MMLIFISLCMLFLQSEAQVSPIHKFLISEFQIITNIKMLPIGIDTSQVMANPGDEWNETDASIIGYSHQRLIFAGKSDSLCFVYYEQGGFEYSTNLVLFEQNGRVLKTLWAGQLQFEKKSNLKELKNAFSKNVNQSFKKFPYSSGIIYLQK